LEHIKISEQIPREGKKTPLLEKEGKSRSRWAVNYERKEERAGELWEGGEDT